MFLLKLLARMYSLFNVKAKATWSVAVYPCVLEGGENHHNDDQTQYGYVADTNDTEDTNIMEDGDTEEEDDNNDGMMLIRNMTDFNLFFWENTS